MISNLSATVCMKISSLNPSSFQARKRFMLKIEVFFAKFCTARHIAQWAVLRHVEREVKSVPCRRDYCFIIGLTCCWYLVPGAAPPHCYQPHFMPPPPPLLHFCTKSIPRFCREEGILWILKCYKWDNQTLSFETKSTTSTHTHLKTWKGFYIILSKINEIILYQFMFFTSSN